jgi:hypothetical protein
MVQLHDPATALARARACVGYPAVYKLGKGGYTPAAAIPFQRFMRLLPFPKSMLGCDCSGFIAWCLGVARDPKGRHDTAWPMWFETTNIVSDAKGKQRRFVPVAFKDAVVGDLIVYPDHKDAKGAYREGHIAIIADPLARTIIDCSSSVSKAKGFAVSERSGAFFWTNATTLIVRMKVVA